MLIWGGSTITGQFLIQLASLSGFCIITVTSSKTAALTRELGASYVVTRDDKSNQTIADEIRQTVRANSEHGELTLAVDIVGPSTAAHAVGLLSHNEPAVIAPLSFLPKGHEVPGNVTVADIQMKQFILDEGSRVYALELNRLIAAGKLRMPQFECLEGGLAAIPAGLEASKRGDRLGRKLVVAI
jgi:NADPH:quinone reductase-like Zn-dependent oxidoreductase